MGERHEDLVRLADACSTSSPSGSVSSYSPSEIVSGPMTAVGVIETPVSALRVDPRRQVVFEDLRVDPAVEKSAAWRAVIDSGSFLRGHFLSSTGWDDNLRRWPPSKSSSRSRKSERSMRLSFASTSCKTPGMAGSRSSLGRDPADPRGEGLWPQRQARRKDMWRSVLTQQLQADMLACEMSSQLLNVAPDPEAKLYHRRWCRTSRATPRRG